MIRKVGTGFRRRSCFSMILEPDVDATKAIGL
jgi:hypothetical protein